MIQVIANKQTLEIDEQALCLIPGPGISIKVPGYTEIDGFATLQCCRNLAEDKAKHILEGNLFQGLFGEMFDTDLCPTSLEDLLESGNDVQHIAGMIILVFEARVERHEKIFLREPETHLHPQQCVKFMTFLNKLMQICKNLGA